MTPLKGLRRLIRHCDIKIHKGQPLGLFLPLLYCTCMRINEHQKISA